MEALFTYVNLLGSFALLGVVAGLLSTYAYLPYIIDTLARRTRPQRASWLIWSVLSSIAFFSQVYEGAGASLWFAGVQCSATLIIFVLSIWLGSGSYLKSPNKPILLAALAGLIIWYFTSNAAYALLITICISLLGGSVTVVKAFKDPDSETLSTWVVSFVASLCAAVSVGKMDFVLMAYPIYLIILCGAISLAMLLGKVVQHEVSLRVNTRALDVQL